MALTHGPRVDLHSHAGRCFLAGMPPDDPIAALLGGDGTAEAITAAAGAGLAAFALSTVADLGILGYTAEGGLCATREFAAGESHADNTRQLEGLRRIIDDLGIGVVRRASDIEEAHRAGSVAVLLACEGADFVEDDLARVEAAHMVGVRTIAPVHYAPNRFADLQTEPSTHGGLSAAGRALVGEMNRLGMIVDLAHATFQATSDALEVSTDPVMISHTHLRGPRGDHPRLIGVDHARVVADAGGLIGAWPSGVTSSTFDDYVDEVVRLIEAVGVDHVAIGTDLDANYQPVMTRHDQFALLAEALERRGCVSDEIDRILGGNALALVETVCG